MAFNYGKKFKHPKVFGLVCYRYKDNKKTTKTLVMAATKKVVPKKDLR